MRPKSRGRIRLTGPNPLDPIQIEANHLSHPDDLKAAIACVELCREIGNSAALRPFAKREVMPGNLKGADSKTSSAMPSIPTGIRPAPRRWAETPCRWSMATQSYGD